VKTEEETVQLRLALDSLMLFGNLGE
jgi:hypothetical protein